MELAQCLRETILNPIENARFCIAAVYGQTDHQNSPLSRVKGSATSGPRHWLTEIY